MAEKALLESQPKGLIAWFASNHVAANILTAFIFCAGIYAIYDIKKEAQPAIELPVINVHVYYPGAGPEEIEESIVIKIEESLTGIEGIDEILSTSREGMGAVSIIVKSGYPVPDIIDEVKLNVDRIPTFPVEAERPIIFRQNVDWKAVLMLMVYGDLDEIAMTNLANTIRQEIVLLPKVSQAELMGTRPFEIAIEVPENRLREYGLTLGRVADQIRQWSVDIPGGSIKSDGGDIRLRAQGQAYIGREFEDIMLITAEDGTKIRLGDIAEINDGFIESDFDARFNDRQAAGIRVMSTEKENELEIAEAVKSYLIEKQKTLPDGVRLAIWGDSSLMLDSQMDNLVDNLWIGAALVFLFLFLMLELRFAAWVLVGLPIAFLGAFAVMPFVSVTINIMSLFAFILVIGIVVDDAIIIAESVHSQTEKDGYSLNSIVYGAQKVATPATFGVLTTVWAFVPFLLIFTGPPKNMIGALAWVVILTLLFSLIESKLILPSHLALSLSRRKAGPERKTVAKRVNAWLHKFIVNRYKPAVKFAIHNRYLTLTTFVSMIFLTIGLIGGGFVRYGFFPDTPAPYLQAEVEFREGVPDQVRRKVIADMTQALNETEAELKQKYNFDGEIVNHYFAMSSEDENRMMAEVNQLASNPSNVVEVERLFRSKIGEYADAKSMNVSAVTKMGGDPVSFKIVGDDFGTLKAASMELEQFLRQIGGVHEINNSMDEGPNELKLRIRPEAETLGLSLSDLARQVREAFYGAEAQRIQRGDDEVKVMVRYPRAERESIGDLEGMWLATRDGSVVPFESVADFEFVKGYDTIRRIEKKRAVSVTGKVNEDIVEPMSVLAQVKSEFEPVFLQRYPGVSLELDGGAKEEQEQIESMYIAVALVLAGLYALIAIPLKSYLQPLIIMSVIPFGLIGAVIGHLLLGEKISMFSMFGFIALGGVVVNDSLILVDVINQKIRAGLDYVTASIEAGCERFRAIVLTSVTTFSGLVPMLVETDPMAKMVIPMAISLAFGILFATLITLILIPSMYVILADFIGAAKTREPLGEEPDSSKLALSTSTS